MTKSERIMFLINLIRTEGAASILDLSRKCKVSQRTIYRDLASLEKMNIPIVADQSGYHLAEESAFSFFDLSPEDLDLLRFCLRNNPLADQPYFSKRLRRLEKMISGRQPQGKNDGHARYFLAEIDRQYYGNGDSGGITGDVLDHFVRAMTEHKIVKIDSEDRALNGVYIPLAVRVSSGGAKLVVTTSMHHAPLEIEVGKVAQLRLTDSTFERRPVELLEP